MNFLYPKFLWALLLLLVPVIIHLLNLQKTKKIQFTNFKFLKNAEKESKKRLRLKNFLILCSRLLFLSFLIFAFAQPYTREFLNIKSNQDYCYYSIDNSISTNIKNDEITNFEKIKSISHELISKNSELTKNIIQGTKGKLSKKKAINYNNSLQSSSYHFDLSKAFADLNYLRTNDISISDVYFISDFQNISSTLISNMKFDSTHNYKLFPVSKNSIESNFFIDSIWFDTPILNFNQTVKVSIRINKIGNSNINDIKVDLFLNGKVNSTKRIKNNFTNSKVVSMDLNLNNVKAIQGKLVISQDKVNYDNDFYFVLEGKESFNVLILSDSENSIISKVLSNEDRFYCNVVNANNVSGSDLYKYDILFVEPQGYQTNIVQVINTFLNNGKSIMIFPSSNISEKDYLLYLAELNCTANNKKIDLRNDSRMNLINPPKLNNPFFQDIFLEATSNVDMPYADPLVNLTDLNANKLLTNKKNNSILIEKKVNNSSVYIWSTALDLSTTNITSHSIFLPIIYQSVINTAKNEKNIYYKLNDGLLRIYNPRADLNGVWKLTNGKTELVSQNSNDNYISFDTDKTNINSGFYDLTGNDSINNRVAINNISEESITKFYTYSDLVKLFEGNSNVKVFQADEIDFVNRLKIDDSGKESLWKKSLILALIFLLIEIILIRVFR